MLMLPVQSQNREEKSLAQNKDLEQTWNSYSNELEQIVSGLVRLLVLELIRSMQINNNNADFDASEHSLRDVRPPFPA